MIGLEAFVPDPPRAPGRPPEDRRALARAFVAKAVLGIPTTSALIERLDVDKSLRRILGWERRSQVPWSGYKLHIDVACGQIPVSCVLTSASVHDSQVAIPLMTMTSARVSYLYDLMDAAYDAAVTTKAGRSATPQSSTATFAPTTKARPNGAARSSA